MLGPEQINLPPRPTPMLLEGAAAVRITEQIAKAIGLRDHQIIRGIIEDRSGILKLILNNREFDWQASKRFKAGDKIDFRVETSPLGKLLQPVLVNDTRAVKSPEVLGSAMLGESPRLMSLLYRPEQVSLLSQLLKPSKLNALLSKASDESLGLRLEQLIFSMSKMSPQMVRSALANSGLFGEYLISNQLPFKADIKQLLRSLLRAGVLQKSDSISLDKAIDEIESRQLEGVQAQQNREVSYHFIIPFHDAEPVELHFERGSSGLNKGESDWVINLHTESKELGEMWAKTTIKASLDIEIIIWTLERSSAIAAEHGKSELENGLNTFGLTLTKFIVLNAQRPSLDPSLSGPGQVLDVTT